MPRPSVCIYRNSLLPRSETFILAQAKALTRWLPFFAGREVLASGLGIGDMPAITYRGAGMGWPARALMGHAPYSGYVHRRFGAAIAERQPRLIHAHFGRDAVHARVLARRLGIPLLVTIHGYELAQRCRWSNPFQGLQDAVMWNRMRALFREPEVSFIAVSRHVESRLLALGASPQRTRVHYIGIDLGRFTPGGGPAGSVPRILYVGRLVAYKACDDLLHAAALLRLPAGSPGPEIRIVGDGPERARFEALATRLGVRAVFLGFQTPEQVREEMRLATVFCAPSKPHQGATEALGMVFLEAQAVGTPVISIRSGGIPEAVRDGETGLLVEPGDRAGLAEAFARLLQDRVLRDAMGAAGIAHVRAGFDLAACTAGLESIYDQITTGAT